MTGSRLLSYPCFRGGRPGWTGPFWLLICVLLVWADPARAWIETQVRGHSARIEVQGDGQASVRHELLLKVRGGPMKTLEITGIGADIEPIADATVRRAQEGSSGRWPLRIATMEDGAVRLGIGAERGLRGGTYLFSFAYRISLRERNGIEIKGDRAVVSWVGPRLSSGVDSARVTFVVPHASSEPKLAPGTDASSAQVLLGEVRRGTQTDEIDLVRAHLATGEPAVWRIEVPASVFPQMLKSAARQDDVLDPEASKAVVRSIDASLPLDRLFWIIGLGGIFGILLWAKLRSVSRLGRRFDARIVPLLPMPSGLRVFGFGLCVATLTWTISLQWLGWSVACLGAALLLSTFLLPVRRVRPRGPGEWSSLSAVSLSKVRRGGGILDARSALGSCFFLVLLAFIATASYRTLPESNYLALTILLYIPLLLPLFFTGGARDFPQEPIDQAIPWYRYLGRVFDAKTCTTELWGRAPLLLDRDVSTSPRAIDETSWDEVRVRIVLAQPPRGLRALEVLFEEGAGAHVSPTVLIRVRQDSPAHLRLPADVPWQRGRSTEERVALIRPPAPTLAQTARLLRSLVRTLVDKHQSTATRSPSSGGSGQLTAAKPAIGISM